MLEFITRRSIWLNILIAIIVSLLLFLIFLKTLNMLTHHGSYLRVPDVKGKTLQEATKILEGNGFEILVQDSVYFDTLAPLAIFKQFPEPDASVKVNRTVYLTINRAEAPDIDMPNLVGMSFRNAEQEILARGLKLGDTTYVPDIAKNAVKDQVVAGKTIKPGTKIRMGSRVSLVLGEGIGIEQIPVPDLYALSYNEALTLLEATGVNLGVVFLEQGLKDTTAGFVYRQNPERYSSSRKLNRIRVGQMIDLWLSSDQPSRENDSLSLQKDRKLSQDY